VRFHHAPFAGSGLNHLKPLHAQAGAQKAADLRVILDNHNDGFYVIHLAVVPLPVAAALRLRAAEKRIAPRRLAG
jgi:hypothetical protein